MREHQLDIDYTRIESNSDFRAQKKSDGDQITVGIPTRNEEDYIGATLEHLYMQDYPYLSSTKVIIADAHSSDRTLEVVEQFKPYLNIHVVPGGLPARARNSIASIANGEYIIFLDADVQLRDRQTISNAVQLAEARNLDCVTAYSNCDGNLLDKGIYAFGNLMIKLAKLGTFGGAYSTGRFMLLRKSKLYDLGGFDENIRYSSDVYLSRRIDRRKFGVVNKHIWTSNRRFRSMGYGRIMSLYVKTTWNHFVRNDEFFRLDHHYWHTK